MPTRDEQIGLALLLGGLGITSIIIALQSGKGADAIGPLAELQSGEMLGPIRCATFETNERIGVRLGQLVTAARPQVEYSGGGRDAFTYFRIVQKQGGTWVTVYGSGLAGAHLAASSSPALNILVPDSQAQPPQCARNNLCAWPWPGPCEPPTLPCAAGSRYVTPIAGAPAQPGPATALLEIYQRRFPEDGDGFASPTERGRRPVQRQIWWDKIMFTAG